VLADRILSVRGVSAVDTELFNWVVCVAYAMVSGLIARIIVMPTGTLAQSLLTDRLLACAIALLAFYACRRNFFIDVGAGVACMVFLNLGRML